MATDLTRHPTLANALLRHSLARSKTGKTIAEIIDMAKRLPELWVLRHGQTVWNTEERLQGWLDSPLTAEGEAQARVQGRILRRAMDARVEVYASPSGRAMHTARLAFEGTNVSVEADAALRELGLGDWQGRTVRELRASGALRGRDPILWKFGAPGGETLAQAEARVTDFLTRLKRPAVLVTHGITSRLIRCIALGRAPDTLSGLPGGQGVVHHVKDGRARVLTADNIGSDPLAPGSGLG